VAPRDSCAGFSPQDGDVIEGGCEGTGCPARVEPVLGLVRDDDDVAYVVDRE
jgi:hypothetical protein